MNPSYIIAALIVGAVGCLFTLIGMASVGWVVEQEGRYAGLFVLCGSAACVSYQAEGAMLGARTLVVISFLCSLAASIDTLVYYIKHIRKETTHKVLAMVNAIVFIIAAVAALLGVIIFGAAGKSEAEEALDTKLSLGYSFGLTIVGGLCSGAAGGLALLYRITLQ